MAALSILELLKQRLSNRQPNPEDRLLHDLQSLPEEFRRSPSVQLDHMVRIAAEERLNAGIEGAVSRVEASGKELLRNMDHSASRWAEQKHLDYLTAAMRSAFRSMPVNVVARRQAYLEIGFGTLTMFVSAVLLVIGGQQLGLLPHPSLSAEQNRKLQWAEDIESSGRAAAVSWAAEKITTDDQLLEARAAVDASVDGRSVRNDPRPEGVPRARNAALALTGPGAHLLVSVPGGALSRRNLSNNSPGIDIMTARSGSNRRRLDRTVTSRWDEPAYAKLHELAEANGKSIGRMLRWLSNRAHQNLPRTKELSRELLQLRIQLNGMASAMDQHDGTVADEIRAVLREIEAVLRQLRD